MRQQEYRYTQLRIQYPSPHGGAKEYTQLRIYSSTLDIIYNVSNLPLLDVVAFMIKIYFPAAGVVEYKSHV